MKTLSKEKTDKFNKIIEKGIDKELKTRNISHEEKVELKSHAIKKALKIKKYVRN